MLYLFQFGKPQHFTTGSICHESNTKTQNLLTFCPKPTARLKVGATVTDKNETPQTKHLCTLIATTLIVTVAEKVVPIATERNTP